MTIRPCTVVTNAWCYTRATICAEPRYAISVGYLSVTDACSNRRFINVYCDESSHLERDGRDFMGLGALSAQTTMVRDVARQIRDIKRSHNISGLQELKWVKVSNSNYEMYREVVENFFNNAELRFRVVVANKTNLNHSAYGQTHDEWYYKMYFSLLNRLLDQRNCYEIYLDLKDTHGGKKVEKMHEVLSNAMYDFDKTSIRRIQLVRSHETALLQIADILIGGVCYANRPVRQSKAKSDLLEIIKIRSQCSLTCSTSLGAEKFNVFHWSGTQAS